MFKPKSQPFEDQIPTFTVRLTYFKKNGTFYSRADYQAHRWTRDDILKEIRELFAHNVRPGLVDGKQDFIVLAEIMNHPQTSIPALIVPE